MDGRPLPGGRRDPNSPRKSHLVAVENVVLEAPSELEAALRWFYGELAGLEERPPHTASGDGLCFKSDRIELRFRFGFAGVIDNVPVRVVIVLPSLEAVVAEFEERKMTYERISGLALNDRRVQVLDPVGHRVELRQSTWVGLL